MSAPSLAPFIAKRAWLKRWMMPLSNWYCNAAGYRQLGLRYAALGIGDNGCWWKPWEEPWMAMYLVSWMHGLTRIASQGR